MWHEDQAWFLRSCAKSLEWLTDQLNHKFMALLSDTMKPLGRQDACKHIGFQMPQSVIEGRSRIFNEVEIATDDDFGREGGSLGFASVWGFVGQVPTEVVRLQCKKCALPILLHI